MPRQVRLLHVCQGAGPDRGALPAARAGAPHRPAGCRGGLPRGPVHAGRAARGALPGRPRVARRQRLRVDCRLPGGRSPARARGDGAAPPRQRRRALRRRAGPAAAGVAVAGDDDRVAEQRARRPSGLARQGAGPAAGNARGGRRAAHPVHDGHPRRHRRRPRRSRRSARGHRRQPRPPRPRAGGDRPELPAQGGHGHAQRAAVPARRLPRRHRPGPADPPGRGPPAGAAQPLRRLLGAARRRHRRLGRRLPRHRRLREPRAALARPRPSSRRHRGRRLRTGAAADDLPRVRARPRALARRRPSLRGARPQRRRGPRS